MPTIVRKSLSVVEARREGYRAITWHMRSNAWNPPTDIYETESDFVVRAEIAGVSDEDFEVVIENNTLSISGSRPDLSERRAYHQMEIRYGKFELAVEISIPVETKNASAEYKNGILTVRFPKTQSKTIKAE